MLAFIHSSLSSRLSFRLVKHMATTAAAITDKKSAPMITRINNSSIPNPNIGYASVISVEYDFHSNQKIRIRKSQQVHRTANANG